MNAKQHILHSSPLRTSRLFKLCYGVQAERRSRGSLKPRIRCGHVVGIDLGTTNSAVAVVKDGVPQVLANASNERTIPSAVAYLQDGRVLVGQEAVLHGVKDASSCFRSVKRLIGRHYEDVCRESGHLSYTVVKGPDGGVQLVVPARGDAGLLSPEQVSAEVLRALVATAENALAGPVDGAVVAVPAYFTAGQRRVTLEAAKLAGLQMVQLLQEPVAAALANGIGRGGGDDTVLVVDLGGGTLDLALLDSFEGLLEVLGTDGDAQLGGDDFTAVVTRWAAGRLYGGPGESADDVIARLPPDDLQQLVAQAEACKIQLSQGPAAGSTAHQGTFTFSLPPIAPSSTPQLGETQLELSQADFDSLTEGLLHRLWPPMQRLAKRLFVQLNKPMRGNSGEGGQSLGDPSFGNGSGIGGQGIAEGVAADRFAPGLRRVTQVVLVGGASQMWGVRELVEQATGLQATLRVDPKECVAIGAAIQAGLLLGELSGVELGDGSYTEALHARTSGFQGWPL